MSRTADSQSFSQFLVPTLHRAVAFPEVDGVAVGIGQYLHFDVPAELHVFLDVDRRIFECILRFSAGLLETGAEGDIVVGDAHSAPAAAGSGFDDDGIADLIGDFDRDLLIFDCALAAGHGGHLGFFRKPFARDFVAHGGHGGHGRADEFNLA
jgi:hypothetical protein